jgi:hypothetical protein
MELMKDPIIMKDGQTYEREAIAAALERNPVSPITRQPLHISDAIQNFALKALIGKFRTNKFPIKVTYPKRVRTATINIDVWLDETIEVLKTNIAELTAIPTCCQTLKCEDLTLEDKQTVLDCSIGPNDHLTVECAGIRVFLKASSARVGVMNIYPYQTVMDLKEQIRELWGMPVEMQMLSHQGKALSDQHFLARYHFQRNTTIYVSGKFLGGVTTSSIPRR